MRFTFHLKKESKKGLWSIKLPILLLMISIIFGLRAFYEASSLNTDQEKSKNMAAEVDAAVEEEIRSYPPTATGSVNSPTVDTPAILPQYAELAQQNQEFYGWIKIDNTIVDYPVMHTPDDPEKYLHLNFDGAYSIAGTIFMDYRCSTQSDDLILYGHNMKNKTMFGSIMNYQDETYWREHQIIRFDTRYEQREYQVVAAFFDRVYDENDTCFKYYNFIEAVDEDTFYKAIHSYQEKALYDTGVSVQYGDQLLTLSTCAYHTKNGRFAVVARRCPDTPQNM